MVADITTGGGAMVTMTTVRVEAVTMTIVEIGGNNVRIHHQGIIKYKTIIHPSIMKRWPHSCGIVRHKINYYICDNY